MIPSFVGHGHEKFSRGCCFVFLTRHSAISDDRLVSVHGGRVLHGNLLLSLVSVMVEPLGQQGSMY